MHCSGRNPQKGSGRVRIRGVPVERSPITEPEFALSHVQMRIGHMDVRGIEDPSRDEERIGEHHAGLSGSDERRGFGSVFVHCFPWNAINDESSRFFSHLTDTRGVLNL